MEKYQIILVILGFLFIMVISIYMSYQTGYDKSKEHSNKILNDALNEYPRTGLFRTDLCDATTKEKFHVIAEFEELARGKNSIKVEYSELHISPTKFNNDARKKSVIEYLGPWIPLNKTEFIIEKNDRQNRIGRLLKDL